MDEREIERICKAFIRLIIAPEMEDETSSVKYQQQSQRQTNSIQLAGRKSKKNKADPSKLAV